jgi:hypothetical protein
MKLIKWKFRELEISMMKTPEGELFCTSAALCSALALREGHLRKLLHGNRNQLAPLSVTDCNSKVEFMRANKLDLGLKRLRTSSLLWPLRQALKVAYLARTEVAWEFIEASLDLVEDNATEDMVSREEFEQLEQCLSETELALVEATTSAERLERLEQIVMSTKTSLELAATAAGRSLQAQRGTKKIRELN